MRPFCFLYFRATRAPLFPYYECEREKKQKTLMASKASSKSFLFFLRSLRRQLANPRSIQRRDSQKAAQIRNRMLFPSDLRGKTLMLDVEGGLLRSSSTFPYFMLAALEAGSLPRGLLLLLLYPLLLCLPRGMGLRVMAFVSFCGIKKGGFRAGRAVLPKHFLEDVGSEAFEAVRAARKTVCVTGMPRVMVEGFLREYLDVEEVVGRELKVFAGYYNGLMEEGARLEKVLHGREEENDAEEQDITGFTSSNSCSHHHRLFPLCKEVHRVTEAEKSSGRPLSREDYPRPLIFHDGRMAFRPTPAAALAMFLWLPFAIPLALFRSALFLLCPFPASALVVSATGMTNRLLSPPPSTDPTDDGYGGGGRLFVCNHRTLLDPIYIAGALSKVVIAVTYSVSPLSEALSPIRTARLTRDKEEDRRRMKRLLGEGDLVVCPEGTTCREPYLLRFSPLFAEIVDDIFPVALSANVTMFYGTTASGFKWLDPFYFLMNPWPSYEAEFLKKISTGSAGAGDDRRYEAANRVQRVIGDALGFKCTMLTRKDKYMMLAGNEGIVETNSHRNK